MSIHISGGEGTKGGGGGEGGWGALECSLDGKACGWYSWRYVPRRELSLQNKEKQTLSRRRGERGRKKVGGGFQEKTVDFCVKSF